MANFIELKEYTLSEIKPYLNEKDIYILQPCYLFNECEVMFREVRNSYQEQREWYDNISKCSISSYQALITQVRNNYPQSSIKFGLYIPYITEYESLVYQLKNQFNYDYLLSGIDFLDGMSLYSAFANYNIWQKYSDDYIFLRYYELTYALISSDLFDGLAHFDYIRNVKEYHQYHRHHYHKIASNLHKKKMFLAYLYPNIHRYFQEEIKTYQIPVL